MLRILGVLCIASILALAVWGIVTLYDANMRAGRMWETPGVKPHEDPIPVMDTRTIPKDGGEARYRLADPASLKAPFELTLPAAVSAGQQGYQYYCIQCHGQHYDGMGTVGQSFAPLPGDLRSAKIQTMPAGQLFHEISYGIPGGRQPALASTIGVDARWQIIAFVKSLGIRR
ncbi:MAG: c-type cytochrome [Desulfobacteraceae bacterium]|jgi:mono/diheme cytochrome c family protein